jgi:hypothetical protein
VCILACCSWCLCYCCACACARMACLGGLRLGSTSGSRRSPPKRSILLRLRVWSCPWSTSRLPKGRRSHDFVAPPGSAPVFPPLPTGGTRGCRNGRREETEGQRRREREKRRGRRQHLVLRRFAPPPIDLCRRSHRSRAAGVGNQRGGGAGRPEEPAGGGTGLAREPTGGARVQGPTKAGGGGRLKEARCRS